jgi:hypothetical protein
MKATKSLRAGALLLLVQVLFSWSHTAHSQGSVTPLQGGGARTVQLGGQTYVLENHVMRVMRGQLAKVNLPGATGVITPACGAFFNGQKMPECANQPAVFEQPAQGTCPAGTIFDIGRWSCWKCPPGFTRGGAAVDSDRACERTATAAERGNKPEFQAAALVGDRCPAGAFFDTIGGGSCWACPPEHNMNLLVHVQAGDKCTRPARHELKAAIRHQRTIWPHDCRDGRFHDIWDGGNCWSCPAGFNRKLFTHINAGDACERVIGAANAHATQRSGGNCEAGTFPHVYNFGMTNARTVCLKCPEGYDQVILEAGDSPRKCQTTTRLVFAKADQDSALTCKPGQEFDLVGLSQQDIDSRAQFRSGTKPQPVQSGTCWSCPSGYYRTLAGVKGNDACAAAGADFYYGVMREPGLFGLGGAAEVLAEILTHDARVPAGTKGLVALALDKAADTMKIAPANRNAFIQEEARKLAVAPQTSGIAAGLIYSRLLTALAEEGTATAAERRLVASFTQYVAMKRRIIAEMARVQYQVWLDTTHWRDRNQVGKNVLDRATMSAFGRPPSFEQAALLSAAGQGALGMGVSTVVGELAGAVKIPVPLLGELAALGVGLATGGYKDYTQGIEKGALSAAKTVGEIAFGVGLTAAISAAASTAIASAITASAVTAAAAGAGFSSVAVASSIAATTALAASGIGIGVGAVMIVASMQLQQLNEFLDAPVKANALLAEARETSKEDLVRMGKTGGGMIQLLTYWSAAIDAGSQLSPAQKVAHDGLVQKHVVLAKAATTQVASTAAAFTWATVPGKANDISVGANGAVWHIGTDARPGGFGIYRWVNNGWQNVPGGAVKVAVDPQGNGWVLNAGNTIYRWDGAKFVQMPGAAKEIAIGANGTVWVLGTATRPGGYEVFRWTGSAWQSVPGGATRIAVDPQGNAWVANDRKEIFRWDGRSFVKMQGLANAIGIGANGTVWHLGTNAVAGGFGLWWWNNGAWTSAPGGLTNLSVAPDGRVWGANSAKDIFRMQ